MEEPKTVELLRFCSSTMNITRWLFLLLTVVFLSFITNGYHYDELGVLWWLGFGLFMSLYIVLALPHTFYASDKELLLPTRYGSKHFCALRQIRTVIPSNTKVLGYRVWRLELVVADGSTKRKWFVPNKEEGDFAEFLHRVKSENPDVQIMTSTYKKPLKHQDACSGLL